MKTGVRGRRTLMTSDLSSPRGIHGVLYYSTAGSQPMVVSLSGQGREGEPMSSSSEQEPNERIGVAECLYSQVSARDTWIRGMQLPNDTKVLIK